MLTNPRDALRGQSMPPNITPFHMLGIIGIVFLLVFSIETLSLRHTACDGRTDGQTDRHTDIQTADIQTAKIALA